ADVHAQDFGRRRDIVEQPERLAVEGEAEGPFSCRPCRGGEGAEYLPRDRVQLVELARVVGDPQPSVDVAQAAGCGLRPPGGGLPGPGVVGGLPRVWGSSTSSRVEL